MRSILIVGMGAGDPAFLTLQAIAALRRADVVFLPEKGEDKAGLNAVRLRLLEGAVPAGGYRVVPFDVPERKWAKLRSIRPTLATGGAALRAGVSRAVHDGTGGRPDRGVSRLGRSGGL